MSKSRNHVGDRTILARASESQMSHFLKNNGLTIVLLLLFAASIIGQWITGWYFENEELTVHGEQAVSLGQYATDPHFTPTVLENWQREFPPISPYVLLPASLSQQRSADSPHPDVPPRHPHLATQPPTPGAPHTPHPR